MDIRPLSQELQQKAIVELNEVPSRLQDDINHILNWIRQQPHLTARTEKQWILLFLRGCKFSLQKTKQKLDLFYTMRAVLPYYFQDRNPFSPAVKTICKLGTFIKLPDEKSNPLAPSRILSISRNGDPEGASIKKCLMVGLMLVDIQLNENDAFIINRQEVIFDSKDAPMGYFGQWTPSTLKTISTLLQHAYPSRLKGIHLINVPAPFYAILKAFKTFLPEKFRDRVHVYLDNDFDSLYKAIPQYVFPDEYGGKAGSISKLAEEMRLKLESYQEWFQEDAQYFSDESKRPGKSIHSDELFNLEGSFRKLEID